MMSRTGETRLNPPAPVEAGGAGAGATLKAAVLACGMLRAITRQPVPTVPVAKLRLGRGGSAYRLTWGQAEGIGGTPTPALPTPTHPPPWGPSTEGGVTAGHQPCLSFPTRAAVQGGRVTWGHASARSPTTSVTCPTAAPTISGTFRHSHLPGVVGTPLGGGGAMAAPGFAAALPSPFPRLGLLNRSSPGGGRAGPGEEDTPNNPPPGKGEQRGGSPLPPAPTLAPRRSWSMVFSASAYLVSSLW